MNNSTTSKKWYQRPENITGLIMGGGFVWLGVHFMPLIIIAAQNTLYAGFLLAALAGVIYAVLDKDIRNIVYYGWKMITRGLTGMLINLDPIAIIETYLRKMEERLEEMLNSKDALGGQIKKLEMVISENTEKMNNSLKKAQAAGKMGNQLNKTTFAMEAQQLKMSNEHLNATRNKMKLMFGVLDKMYVNTEFILQNTKRQVDIKKREREAIMAGHRAMQSGWRIIKGDPEQKAMYDQAMENIADTMGRQLSEMERIMSMSSNIMDGVDLEKGIIKDDALQMFSQWEKEGDSMLLGPDKNILLSQSYEPEMDLDILPTEKQLTKTSKFNNLLE